MPEETQKAEAIQEAEAVFKAFIQQVEDLTLRKTDKCPSCHQVIDRMEQIGRCVYAEPCGCRLWQGSVPDAWRE